MLFDICDNIILCYKHFEDVWQIRYFWYKFSNRFTINFYLLKGIFKTVLL